MSPGGTKAHNHKARVRIAHPGPRGRRSGLATRNNQQRWRGHTRARADFRGPWDEISAPDWPSWPSGAGDHGWHGLHGFHRCSSDLGAPLATSLNSLWTAHRSGS